uniref:Retrotransposon protein, putative, Ty1-copia subclass n=1 Tax=Oryza sativa subsp. japonica TaxID=39947 RepID=Q2QS73_ORYSJ|nr:retrotransposon protein, putative, Ty1-copia subclass [Oryza sativa Japonica Group]
MATKEFDELALDGTNYPIWASDIKINFASRGILNTIEEPNDGDPAIEPRKLNTALFLLRLYIHKDLKHEYMLETSPLNLWKALKERYDQQKELIWPEANYEWVHLRLQDFKTMAEYNHAVHNICSRLKFCEQEPTENNAENKKGFKGNSSNNPKNLTGKHKRNNNRRKFKGRKKGKGKGKAPQPRSNGNKHCNRTKKSSENPRFEAHFNLTHEECPEVASSHQAPADPESNLNVLPEDVAPLSAMDDMFIEYCSTDPLVDAFHTWHDRLGHPGIEMMRKIIGNSIGHHLITDKFSKPSDFVCTACATGKLILRPSYLKIRAEPLKFLERIQGDICGPIVPKSGPFRKVGIYVGFKSPLIIKYLEPLTGDLFTARFADSIFDEEHFPALGGDFKYQKECHEINWDAHGIPATNSRTTETDLQVQKIIHLQRLANNLPDAFTNYKGVTKSLIPAQNAPERVEVPNKTTQLPLTKKRGRSMATQRETIVNKQRKTVNANQPLVGTHQIDTIYQADRDSLQPSSVVHNVETRNSEDHRHIVSGDHDESIRVDEIAINYSKTGESFNRRATIVDTNFSEQIAECLQVDPEPRSIKECQKGSHWNKWNDAIDVELASLYKRDVFSAVMPTPCGIFPVGYKWVFVRKRNENNEVLMDVVTAYLYGSLDSDIYMKVPDGIDIPNQKKSLYGLKQSGRMWYNRLSEFLSLKGYTKNEDCPCVFIKKSPTRFCIISVYVDDLNIIGNTQDINEARHHLKTEFEMKDLGQTKFFLGLQLEHLPSGILVHQSAYTQKILEKFNMDKSYPSKTPMVVRFLDVEKDPFRPKEDGEDVLNQFYPHSTPLL